MASVGVSVARDSEARLSMIRFTHSCRASAVNQHVSCATQRSRHSRQFAHALAHLYFVASAA